MSIRDDIMEGHDLDRAGVPVIERVSGKIAQLERMADHREGRLERGEYSRGSESFLRQEASALRAAIAALRFHRGQVEGLDDAVSLLAAVVDDYREHGTVTQGLLVRAERLLEEWGV